MLAGSPALVSPMKRGWPVPLAGGEGSDATALRAIVYTSPRDALTVALRFEGGGRATEDVRTEKEGAESSRRACARVPSSQLETTFSTESHKL
jgi:hypothetical protein